MNLTEQDIRDLRRQGDLGALLKQARAAAAAENARRRALVLRHPDLAARLTEAPISHTTPEHWTGYVPPAHDPENFGGGQPLNNSPIRAALAALVAEAEARAGQTAQRHDAAA
ncbi:hypothetical protein ACFW5V_28760 [Streptomyces sp. NPDC058762]|uniref:hypothetical protein n=1 Tax=Streptomyces sp. NPDC058762 TaxID=3346629 RepID=UPI00368DD7A8